MNPFPAESDAPSVAPPAVLSLAVTFDPAINYAFQQNAIPVIKELLFQNDDVARKDLVIRVTTEPAFAAPVEIRLQGIAANGEYRVAPLDLILSHDFLAGLNEKISGWLKIEVIDGDAVICARTEQISLLARNEWCGLVSLPEILAAFILPNDGGVMTILDRASELLREHTGRGGFNAYQDKSRKRAWEQIAAIYKAVGELGLRYMVAPASFETTGQKVRTPSDILAQRFGNCLDLSLLFAACCEQVGLHPLVLIHEGHAYAGCWLEETRMAEPAVDDLQHMRKLATDSLITVFESTAVADERPGTLDDAELLARPHLDTHKPFRLALDVRRSRIARIHPLPIPGQAATPSTAPHVAGGHEPADIGLGGRVFIEPLEAPASPVAKAATRIDQWKSRLLDLSLRNRLLNFKETKSTIRILSAAPEHVEDELAASRELSLQPKPKLMSEDDPRNAATYTKQQRTDALNDHLQDELAHGRLRTGLDESEHARRLTELFRAARVALDENGTNTLFAAVGFLEWRETEHSDRILRAPLLLVPVELKRKSVLEGFTLRRIDEETRLNVTLMEMLRQNFQKEIPGLDPLPEDDSGVNVARVFQLFRDAVRDLAGWEVRTDIWLGQFSFTKFLLWKDIADRLDDLTRNRIVNHLVHDAGTQYPNPPDDIKPPQLDDQFHPRDVFCPRSADSSQLAAVMAAAAGHDYVLEGPPGTGKSQTITNIIAHCLSQGKRVLFVAEKRAALDVVHRRLREDGLEPFCLELHSNKTGKADVLAQFDRSLKFIDESSTFDWEHRTAELEKLRTNLNAYTRALHRRNPSGLSAYHCLDYLLPRKDEPVVRFDRWPTILETSAETLDEARLLSRLLQERSRPLVPLADHPLAPLACEEWSPSWAERTLDRIRELGTITASALEASRDLRTWLRCSGNTATRQELAHFSALVESLLAPEPVGAAFATTPWNQLAEDLDSWIALTRERTELRAKLTPLHVPAPANTVTMPCEAWTDGVAERISERGRELGGLTKTAIEATRDLRTWLHAPGSHVSREGLAQLVALVDSLLDPAPVAESFAVTPWNQWVRDFDGWIALVKERVELRTALVGYDEDKLLALELDLLNQKWLSAQSAWFLMKWLRIGAVRRQLRTVRPDNVKPDPTTLGNVLTAALRLRTVNAALVAATPQAEKLLGDVWGHSEPHPEMLDAVRSWGATLHDRLIACAPDGTDWQVQLRNLVGGLFRDGAATYAIGTTIGNRLARYRDSIGKFDEAFDAFATEAALARDSLDEAQDHLTAVKTALGQFLPAVQRLRAINAQLISAAPTAQACLGVMWAKGEPSSDSLAKARAWGELLHARMLACAGDDLGWLGLLRQLLAGLFGEGPAIYAPGTSIGERMVRYCEALARFSQAYDAFEAEVLLRREPFDTATDHLVAVQALTERLPTAWRNIRDWCSWQKARHQGLKIGLHPVIEKLESPEGHTLDLPALFERSFRRAMLFASIETSVPLREFFGREHSERIERFREVDEKLATLARDLIRAKLAAGIPRDQLQSDIPKAEIGLLRKEIGKKTRHIPVRQLLSRIPKLLPKLKPCVLMSPLSVAQYLEASHESFDVVIFDEASQIPVWDAVGAIARGQQLIVVGDPKQLPPTNFFNSSGDDEDDRTPEEHKDLESILDELMTNGLRHKRLQWHYRSRHEGLITFSNRQYYENDLLTFPSPESGHGGVRFKHLPEARYDKGKSRTNRGEAEALVEDLVSRLRKTDGPRRS
ncbi:MAG: DUF4011 domain-containing protein [Verrucomicrobiota bacterium]